MHYLFALFMAVLLMQCAAGGTPTTSNVAASLQKYADPLPQMPRLQAGPAKLTIGMYPIRWKFHRQLPPTPVFAYGTSAATATVPGPLIEAVQGVPACITWENHLPPAHILPWDPTITTAIPKIGRGIPTVVHLHGGIHPPASDGNPFAWFTANFTDKGPTWTQPTYSYPNVQRAGNLWYHDHALGLTRVNLLAGLIGPYVIREPTPNPSLPSGPEFDRHLMIFDRSFLMDGSLYMNRTGNNPSIHPQWQPEFFGDAIIVNGKAWPYLQVRRAKYRFRIINASNARYFRLFLCQGLQFNVIGSDGSYLPSPVTSPTILLAPAEIFDVVVDFSPATGQECLLTNDAPYPYPTGNKPDQQSNKVMKFVIKTPRKPIIQTQIPPSNYNYSTVEAAAAAAASALTRYITLYEYQSSAGTPTVLYINGKKLTDPVTETPRLGTTEVWEVINLTGDNHPLHIHLAEFQATKVQQLVNLTAFTACMMEKKDAVACNVTEYAKGKLLSVPAYEKTWKNVVKIEPGYKTTVVVKFNLVDGDRPYPFDATSEPGYVYHCHILDHEDNEMIRPLKLVR